MTEKLIELYIEKFLELDAPLNDYNSKVNFDKKATNPFLINVPEDYYNFKNKIMIFGQETNTWCNECGNKAVYSNSLKKSLEVYNNFYLNGGINSYSGPFWNEFKRIRREVTKSKDAVFIWNNINKIGRIGKGNVSEINEIQFQYFQVIKEEINLLKPNIIVFLTGPDYDLFITKNVGKFNSKKISDSIHELTFQNEFNDIKTFKTYHPNALYFQGKNRIVIPELINMIKEECF